MLRYLRLLNYENACKVISFINTNDKKDFANVTHGGVSMDVSDENWDKVETYIKSLNVTYEIGTVSPHIVEKQIVEKLKNDGIIK